MKAFSSIIILVLLVFAASSCQSNRTQSRSSYYSKINKNRAIENQLVESSMKNARYTVHTPPQRTSDYSAETTYMERIKSESSQFKVIYDDSEYANGDVYIEAAKRREALINQRKAGCKDCPSTTDKKAEKQK